AIHFHQRIFVPEGNENAKGTGAFQGNFELGEGNYQVDWMMRDQGGRVCSHFWTVKAALPPKYSGSALVLAPGAVHGEDQDLFDEEPPTQKLASTSLPAVKIFLNYAPASPESVTFNPNDKSALLSILRNIARDPKIGRLSLTVFNLEQRRVLYRQP